MNIELHDIVKQFGALEAVSHVSLDIQAGELFTLLGPSGCGKTTILRLIGGFHKPDQGTSLFGGKNVIGQAHLMKETSAWFFRTMPCGPT